MKNRYNSISFRSVILPVSLLSLFVLPTACKNAGSGNPENRQNRPDICVDVQPVRISSDVKTVPYVGVVKAVQTTNVTGTVGGRVKRIMVRKGENVKAGQIVAEISSEYVQSAYDIAEATVQQARDGYDRMMQLYGKGGVTEIKKKEVETQLRKAEAAYRSASESLDKCQVKIPYDGVVEEIFVEEGVEIGPLMPMIRLSNVERMEISFPVPENEIAALSLGQKAEIAVPALDTVVAGKVSVKGVSASPLSHSYECQLELQEHLRELLPGMVCKVYLHKEQDGVIVIPLSSVMVDMDGRYVWTVSDGVVEKTRVEVDGFASEGVIVTDGLSEGDQVIVEGKRKVSTGMKVKAFVVESGE